ncbi:hypothetical protein PUNSTDRAFT_85507 [Punctularia strigosozonata HHB-11173 SS5]|uniref:uncharacterized protein n=1 Tax=Punctularia strigosozonata (strain HHB-11173) TaxID=741275 RepID=UPI0004417309|nr:uncharacterized protein PUNSTDRAFT_85507 [Punctularia strigosozonata HHB-11173 SS5]EIN11014.1 hypothetical protein PUNSTDRAFT_85507 [Punctularia strigosozonata HHB-11173 SS5]
MSKANDSFTFTVGKLDAGMAILLGERAHLIEFPSLLLPPGTTTGSIVNIAVHQNVAEEERRDREFWELQNDILETFGTKSPEPPKLELRNVTQTSVTLEWPSLSLATAKLRSLDIYKNGERLATIPAPLQNTSTKLSGLELDHEYTFQLVLRTTAGTYPSNIVRVRTHTMTDTSGISVCFGNVQDSVLLENAKLALREMRAKWSDKIQIDTTHFVCTTPAATPSGSQASGSMSGAPGVEYQRALQLSIPVVQPQWILACHADRRMVPIAQYYLGVTPSAPINSAPFTRPQSMSQVSLQRAVSPSSPGVKNRASMPPMSRAASSQQEFSEPMSPTSAETQARASKPAIEPTPEEEEEEEEEEDGEHETASRTSSQARGRTGTMNKQFRFPSPGPSWATPPVPPLPSTHSELSSEETQATSSKPAESDKDVASGVLTPTQVEVPPPPPVEKERSTGALTDEGDDDVGATEEIPL